MVNRERLARLWGAADELETLVWRLLCVFAFCVPWSIAASQTILTLAFVAAVRHWQLAPGPSLRSPLTVPVLAFVFAAFLAAVLGLDPAQSLWGLRTYLQLVVILLVHRYATTNRRIEVLLRCFLAGMILTSTHTVWNAVLPWKLPEEFPGGMTESGQLLFAIGLTLGASLFRVSGPKRWAPTFALYVASLLANLKRGAWLGTLVVVAVLGGLRSRKLILTGLAVLLVVVAFVGPVRERIADSVHDFFLPGSRYDIWMAAVDVIDRFPAGVGRKNGDILRDYPNIPQKHRHAHNNLLQITLENGYLGAATFLWWMITFGWLAWRNWITYQQGEPLEQAVTIATFGTFLGFHVAGIVEYNFGDTEVLQVLFIFMGITLALRDRVELAVATRENPQAGKGFSTRIVASRPAPTDTSLTGTPTSSAIRSR